MNGSRNPQRHGERSSLDALNRTIEGLEARIEGLMATGREPRGRAEPARYDGGRGLPLRDDPVSEIMQRQRAIDGGRERLSQRPERRPVSADHHAAVQHAQSAYGAQAQSAYGAQRPDTSVKDIAEALVSLRHDLKRDIADGLDREMQSLRAEIRGIRQMAESRGGTDDLREELHRLSTGIGQLGRQSSEGEGLRVEFDELRSVLDGLAREDSVRRMEDRWSGVEQKLSAFDRSRDDELVALAYRLDELKAQINAVSATPAIRALEGRIEQIAHAVDTLAHRPEPDGGRFTSHFEGLDARLDEISRAIAASGRMQQSASADHTMMQRLEGRIADLAGQLDQMARRPVPAPDQGLGLRIEALAGRIEELASEQAALRLEERIEQLSQMLEQQSRQAPAAGGDELAYYLSDISRKIDALDQGSVNDELAGRLDALARRIDGLDAPVGSPFADGRFSQIEGRLSAIADRLDATRVAPAGDHEALRGLEAQIAHLSTLIGGAPSSGPAAMPAEVESRLATIEDYMATNDEYIVEAARQAAEAVMEAYRHTGSAGAPAPDMDAIAGLADDLRTLEDLTRSSEERTARTFDALHDTLVQIAGRLEQLDAPRENFGRREAAMPRAEMPEMRIAEPEEASIRLREDEYPFEDEGFDLAGDRPAGPDRSHHETLAEAVAEAAVALAEPAAKAEPEKGGLLAGLKRRFSPGRREPAAEPERRHVDPTPSIDPIDELEPEEANQLLEPGSGVPDVRRILERVRAGQTASGRTSLDAGADKSDFIAAARRAARMAAEEADTMARVAPAKKAEKPAAGGKSGSALARHRRPILLAVGAVLLAIMSYPLVNALTRGDAAPAIAIEQAAVATDTAVSPVEDEAAVAAEPETALAEDTAVADVSEPATDGHAGADMLTRPADPAEETMTAGFEPVETETLDTFQPAPAADVDTAAIVVPDAIAPASLANAAADGDPLALFEIGARYTEGRGGVAMDLAEAAHWYGLSAGHGFAPAEYRLANLYEKGQGVERDLTRARDLYQQAAGKGNASAMHNLAVLLATGIGNATPDFDGAATWFRKASDLGVRDSQFNLAILYARGNGVTQDLEESYKWFAIAARDGDRDAAEKRDEVANAMTPEQLSGAKAKVELWKPQPLDDKANSADLPDEWAGAATKTASVDMKKAIRNIQAILNNNGFNAGQPDGQMGKKTVAAIKAFQKSVGQPETGEIDDALVSELLKRNKQPE